MKLAAEREEAKTAKRQVEHLETERVHIRKQLDNMCMLKEEEERKSSKYEVKSEESDFFELVKGVHILNT